MSDPGQFMLIGEIEAGKTTLINALFGKGDVARKTQAIEFEGNGMDTPGEYFSHPRFFSALLSSAQTMLTLVYVHAADRQTCRLPPGLLDVYAGKSIIGVITKTDLPEAQPDVVEALLRAHGIHGPIYRVSPNDPAALQVLKTVLLGGGATAKECLS
ncbi:MAG: EutP/PduV family microcompartment system protein [Propionivibrio sp.]